MVWPLAHCKVTGDVRGEQLLYLLYMDLDPAAHDYVVLPADNAETVTIGMKLHQITGVERQGTNIGGFNAKAIVVSLPKAHSVEGCVVFRGTVAAKPAQSYM